MSPLPLQVTGLSVTRPPRTFHIPALEVAPAQCVALLGPTGSGKTTLLLGLLHLARGASVQGTVCIHGRTIGDAGTNRSILRDCVAFALQDSRAAFDPLLSLGRQLRAWTGASAADCLDALQALDGARLAHVDPDARSRLSALLARRPDQVSGGQAQRVLLAVALLRRPKLWIADEPTASLDDGRRTGLVRMLKLLTGQTGTGILCATHDVTFARQMGATPLQIVDDVVREGFPPRPEWPRRTGSIGKETIVAARGVVFRYGSEVILDGVDLSLRAGESVALLGASGSGKTTLARVLCGQLQPTAGKVERANPRARVLLVPQDAAASLTPGRTVLSLVKETARPGLDVAALASALRLPLELLPRSVATLSGGERRRAALLRAFAAGPSALLLDEPTASLDRAAAVAVVEVLLATAAEQGTALLWITHDEELAAAVADRVLSIEGGLCC